MGTMRAELIGLALRVRTLAAEDVVFIYAEPDHADLDQLLKEQLYRNLLAEILSQADRQTVYKG
jgi:predicted lipid-binding transport protein (Tim44 family)